MLHISHSEVKPSALLFDWLTVFPSCSDWSISLSFPTSIRQSNLVLVLVVYYSWVNLVLFISLDNQGQANYQESFVS